MFEINPRNLYYCADNFKNLTRKEMRTKYNKIMIMPILLKSSENQVIKEEEKSLIKSAEMSLLRVLLD